MDTRLRQLRRAALSGDAEAQAAYTAYRERIYPQCRCPQDQMITTGCSCGNGPDRPIFDLETVLRNLGFWVSVSRDEMHLRATNQDWLFVADICEHSLLVYNIVELDVYYVAGGYNPWEEVDCEVTTDLPYTWEEWDPLWQDLCHRQLTDTQN